MAALEIIENFAVSTAELLDIMTSGYSESYKKLKGIKPAAFTEKKWLRDLFRKARIKIKNKQQIYHLVHRLEKDGLIKPQKQTDKKTWFLTEKGVGKKNKFEPKFFLSPIYPKERSNQLTIIAFDIPEYCRWKRDWLRSVLKNLGMKFLQRSLWIGKVTIPKEFIYDLGQLNLLPHVEIFSVAKSGTIKKII